MLMQTAGIIVAFAAIIAAGSRTLLQTPCWTILPGEDFYGNDLETRPRQNTTEATCREMCIDTVGCFATVYKDNGGCWLKNGNYGDQPPLLGVPGTVSSTNVSACPRSANASQPINPTPPTAAPKPVPKPCWVEYKGQDFWGSNLETEPRINVTAAQCVRNCIETRGCAALSLKQDGRCYLKNSQVANGPLVPIRETVASYVVAKCRKPTGAALKDPVMPAPPNATASPVPGMFDGNVSVSGDVITVRVALPDGSEIASIVDTASVTADGTVPKANTTVTDPNGNIIPGGMADAVIVIGKSLNGTVQINTTNIVGTLRPDSIGTVNITMETNQTTKEIYAVAEVKDAEGFLLEITPPFVGPGNVSYRCGVSFEDASITCGDLCPLHANGQCSQNRTCFSNVPAAACAPPASPSPPAPGISPESSNANHVKAASLVLAILVAAAACF